LWREFGLFHKAGSESKADGQVVLVHSMDQLKKARKGIPDILLWLEAFGTLVATSALSRH